MPQLVLCLGLRGSAAWAVLSTGQLVSLLQRYCTEGGWAYAALRAQLTGDQAYTAFLVLPAALRLVLCLGLKGSAAWAAMSIGQLALRTLLGQHAAGVSLLGTPAAPQPVFFGLNEQALARSLPALFVTGTNCWQCVAASTLLVGNSASNGVRLSAIGRGRELVSSDTLCPFPCPACCDARRPVSPVLAETHSPFSTTNCLCGRSTFCGLFVHSLVVPQWFVARTHFIPSSIG